ncbi:ankyrin [Penicillium paradoxum]|uniref:ankyrin n=1 Tax=Penicillium paradoxum TaxID=176176 RepID=UPI0025495D5D|nr:ankyrin [Penicillium paradoxum]KAJ5778879.1 ankyrin [Penicillium paradoxum]
MLLALPTECLLQVASELRSQNDLNALISTSRRLHGIFNHSLYEAEIGSDGAYRVISFAAQKGHTQTVQMILKLNANRPDKLKKNLDPNKLAYGRPPKTIFWPPLAWAAVRNDEVMVETLLKISTIKVDIKCPAGRTPLSYAAEGGHIGVARLLLDAGANPNSVDKLAPPLTKAPPLVCEGKVLYEPLVPLPLAWPDIEYWEDLCSCPKSRSKHRDFSSSIPPSALSAGRYKDIVTLLLQHGVDIDIADSESQTSLTAAAACGYQSFVELLVDHGAALDYTDKSRPSPLSRAAEFGCLVTVKYLLDRGALVDSDPSSMSISPLALAAMHGHDECVEILLEHTTQRETDLNKMNWQALVCAAQYGHVRTVSMLLSAHSRLWPDHSLGSMAVFFGAHEGHTEVIKLLLAAGAEIDPCPERYDQMSCLHAAAMNNHLEAVKFLLDSKKIDVNSKDAHGWTALDWAERWSRGWFGSEGERGSTLVKELLLDHGLELGQTEIEDIHPPHYLAQSDYQCACSGPAEWPISFRCERESLAEAKRSISPESSTALLMKQESSI